MSGDVQSRKSNESAMSRGANWLSARKCSAHPEQL